ncbi:Fanconi-associated nuclease 1 [Desmophyllum pertusum]|uniref:Fanconi-associated nuclease n=1 Tax=Desmophyllum pertusum TaxID=174260 RepID=A0A9X0D328_9CNID|nr:Fanconi-associated nuclease 1 [Desmophyllum pertusum]
MCYLGVEVLQKWRRYEEAVNQLETLLQQDVFCFDSRGRWYDRLALNLHQHLKQPEKAMIVIRQALFRPTCSVWASPGIDTESQAYPLFTCI